MMLWAMQSIAHGADYVSFFRWRTVTYGPEMYWHGLLDYDNRPNRKLAELQRLHARVEAIQEMAGAEYIALLGLVKDYDNVFDAQLDAWHGDLANASEMELFVASQLAHTPMDALYLDHAALEDLQRYPMLFCPHQEILTPSGPSCWRSMSAPAARWCWGPAPARRTPRATASWRPCPGCSPA